MVLFPSCFSKEVNSVVFDAVILYTVAVKKHVFDFHDIPWIIPLLLYVWNNYTCGCAFSYLVLAVVGPNVIETRGREERRRMSEDFTAVSYWEKHLQTTYTHTHTGTNTVRKGMNLNVTYKNLSIQACTHTQEKQEIFTKFMENVLHLPAPLQTRLLWTPMALTPLQVGLPLWSSHTLPQTRTKLQSGDIMWANESRWKMFTQLNKL